MELFFQDILFQNHSFFGALFPRSLSRTSPGCQGEVLPMASPCAQGLRQGQRMSPTVLDRRSVKFVVFCWGCGWACSIGGPYLKLTLFQDMVTYTCQTISSKRGFRNHCNCGWEQRSKYSLQEIHPDPKCQCRVYICLHLVNLYGKCR